MDLSIRTTQKPVLLDGLFSFLQNAVLGASGIVYFDCRFAAGHPLLVEIVPAADAGRPGKQALHS